MRTIGIKKKIAMKKILLILSIFTLFVGCQKEHVGETIEFTGQTPITKSDSKTTLVPNESGRYFDVKWMPDDQIKVYGSDGMQIYTNNGVYDDDNNQVAHFTCTGTGVSGPDFVSFYPAGISQDEKTFNYSQEQSYVIQDHINGGYVTGYPMYAKQSDQTHLYYKNLASIIVLRVKGPSTATIKNVYISEPNDPAGNPLCGKYNVMCSGPTENNDPVLTPIAPGYKITLGPCNAQLNVMRKFYIYTAPATHKWLMVGLNYTMNGSTYTTWQSIYAQSYTQSGRFKFERSKWSMLDVDFANLDGSLVYSVNDISLTPSGTNDTIIATGVPICNTNPKDYTLCFDFTPASFTPVDGNGYIRKTLYSEQDNISSNWKGVVVRLANNDGNANQVKFEVGVGSTSNMILQAPINLSANTRYRYVVVFNASTGKCIIYYKNARNTIASVTYSNRVTYTSYWRTTTNPNPQIGGDQHITNRYFQGTIHKFAIYQAAWTQQQATNWINAN